MKPGDLVMIKDTNVYTNVLYTGGQIGLIIKQFTTSYDCNIDKHGTGHPNYTLHAVHMCTGTTLMNIDDCWFADDDLIVLAES